MQKKFIPLLLLVTTLQGCYVGKTLLYQTAGIYDFKIFKNNIVATNIPQAIPKSAFYNRKSFPEGILPLAEKLKTTAFVVIKDDSLIFEQYWNEANDSTISNSFSMAKSLVSLLVGFAIQDGFIKSVDQYACEFLPEFSHGCKKHIRIRDLLTMSSGLAWDESYVNPFGKTAKAYYGRNLYKQMTRLNVSQTPGYTFKYLSASTQILGLLITKATGKSLSQYLSEKLWQPLGAEHQALWSIDRKGGNEKAYCCFNATARDYAKIGLFGLHEGNWKGKQLLSGEYIKQSFTPASNLSDKDGNSVDFYGYQWWILNYKNMKINMACGLYGQYIIMIPQKKLVIVRLGHKTSNQSIGHFNADVYSYVDAGLTLAE